MAIEAGARSGLVAVDDKTVEYFRGRPFAPNGVLWDQPSVLAHPAHRRGREVRHRGRGRRARHQAAGHLGHLARDGAAGGFPRAGSRPRKGRRAPQRHGARAGIHGPEAQHPADRYPRGPRVHRFLHQLRIEDLRAAAAVARGKRVASNVRRPWWCRARAWSSSRPSAKGWTRSSSRPASNGASPAVRCAGHERRPAGAGRALRLHVQPQLRRPPGPGRPHAPVSPAMAAAAAVAGHFVDVRSFR